MNRRTGAKDGDFSQTAQFNDANQLTQSSTAGSGRGVAAGVASYSYDGAGNRTSQSVAGTGTSYAYNPAGQTSTVTREGRTTSYAYDGLGRQAATTDQTKYGITTTRNTYNGDSIVQTQDSAHGTSTLLRDAAGALAEHVTSTGDATWDLLDGLGSTIAGARGSSITELTSYDDWGAQTFETTGWSSPTGYTGHSQDPTQTQLHAPARSYDPATATWTTPDSWRGLLTQPTSLSRYQYVGNNPASYLDPDGHLCAARSGRSDALPLGCGAPPAQAHTNVKMPPPPPPYVPKSKPKSDGPNSRNVPSALHPDWKPGALGFQFPSGPGGVGQFQSFLQSHQGSANGAVLVCKSANLGALVSGSVSDCRAYFQDGHSAPVVVLGLSIGVGAGAYGSITAGATKAQTIEQLAGLGFNVVADASAGAGVEVSIDLVNGMVSGGAAAGGRLYGGLQVTWTIPGSEPCSYGGPTCYGSTVTAFPSKGRL